VSASSTYHHVRDRTYASVTAGGPSSTYHQVRKETYANLNDPHGSNTDHEVRGQTDANATSPRGSNTEHLVRDRTYESQNAGAPSSTYHQVRKETYANLNDPHGGNTYHDVRPIRGRMLEPSSAAHPAGSGVEVQNNGTPVGQRRAVLDLINAVQVFDDGNLLEVTLPTGVGPQGDPGGGIDAASFVQAPAITTPATLDIPTGFTPAVSILVGSYTRPPPQTLMALVTGVAAVPGTPDLVTHHGALVGILGSPGIDMHGWVYGWAGTTIGWQAVQFDTTRVRIAQTAGAPSTLNPTINLALGG